MKTRTLLRFTTFALGALLLAATPDAGAQIWQGGFGFQGGCNGGGDEIHTFAQTFTAPATNPELRQLWVLAEAQDGSGTDNANFLVVPWSDEDSRPAGLPVFVSGAKMLPPGPGRKTMTIWMSSPVMLTPGARYAIVMHLTTAPAGTLAPTSIGCDAANPFPAGSAFELINTPPSGWATFPWDVVGTPGTDIALQPAFTQPGPTTTVMLYGAKDGNGSPVNGSPGTTFVSFGIPSRNTAGIHAFVAKVRLPDGKTKWAVCRGLDPEIVAMQDNQVPGRPGVFFSSFKDPLLAEDGRLLVLATLKGDGITSENDKGLYTNNPGGGLLGLLHEGDEPPGVPGARIKTFRSIAASSAGIGVVHQMVSGPGGTAGPGGVTTADDTAFTATDDLWLFASATTIIREGSNFSWGLSDSGMVHSFSALTARTGAAGNGHGVADVHDDGEVFASAAIQVKFEDGRTGNFRVIPGYGPPTLMAITSGLLHDIGTGDGIVQVTSVGIPAQAPNGPAGFVAKFKSGIGGVTNLNDLAICGHEITHGIVSEDGSYDVEALVRKGDAPFGTTGVFFAGFSALAPRNLGDTGTHEIGHWMGFAAKLAGPGVTPATDLALSRKIGNQWALVARESGEAPGVAGSQFKSFTSLGFMDYTEDSCMNSLMALARMRTGADGAPGPGGVTTLTDEGLWLFDHNGDGHLAFREGNSHIIGGVPKLVKKFIVLPTVGGSPAQTRSHNAAGEIILRAIFTDGTCALVKLAQ